MADPFDPKRLLPDSRGVRFAAKEKAKQKKRRQRTLSSDSGSEDINTPISKKETHRPTPKPLAPGGSWNKIALLFGGAFALLALMLSIWSYANPPGDLTHVPSTSDVREILANFFRTKRRSNNHIPPHLVSYINSAITAALKDPVGRRDFALAADGARIATKLTAPLDTIDTPARPPQNILDEDLRSGSCWSFPEAQGQVAVKLPTFVYPTNITIDHVPRDIAADITQAPREIVVWGLLEGKSNQKRYAAALDSFRTSSLNGTGEGPPITGGGDFLPLAAFEYSIDSHSHIQTFAIDPSITASRIYFGVVVFEIKRNWGASSTRLYRVRVHGSEVLVE